MRHLLPTLVIGSFAAIGAQADAQYIQGYIPAPTPIYRYAYPPGVTYAPQYWTVAPRYVRPPNPTGYVNRPYYGAYGYGIISNGSTDGLPPFRGRRYR